MGEGHGHTEVRIPGRAVDADARDVGAPSEHLLEALHLLGTDQETKDASGFKSALFGPPDSVAVIEAGATALSKWWAAGIGGAVIAVSATVRNYWEALGNNASTKNATLIGASIVIFAGIIAISHIVASDLRGRALAAVATINARALVGNAMLTLATGAASYQRKDESGQTFVPLPPLGVSYVTKPGDDESGWRAIAISVGEEESKYLVVKFGRSEWAKQSDLVFDAVGPNGAPIGASLQPENGKKKRSASGVVPI